MEIIYRELNKNETVDTFSVACKYGLTAIMSVSKQTAEKIRFECPFYSQHKRKLYCYEQSDWHDNKLA